MAKRLLVRQYARFYVATLLAAIKVAALLLFPEPATSLTATIVTEKEAAALPSTHKLGEPVTFQAVLNFDVLEDLASSTTISVSGATGLPSFSNINVPLIDTKSTVIASDASAGDTTITVISAAGFAISDLISVTTEGALCTDVNIPCSTEFRNITNIAGSVLTLDKALRGPHPATSIVDQLHDLTSLLPTDFFKPVGDLTPKK